MTAKVRYDQRKLAGNEPGSDRRIGLAVHSDAVDEEDYRMAGSG
jgi:hypothetical protein